MYSDLTKYTFWDETSQFDTDPSVRWVGGAELYEREYTCYLPARLIRRAPDLIDEFIAKYADAEWLWGITAPDRRSREETRQSGLDPLPAAQQPRLTG